LLIDINNFFFFFYFYYIIANNYRYYNVEGVVYDDAVVFCSSQKRVW
jgi:hypothetical protein